MEDAGSATPGGAPPMGASPETAARDRNIGAACALLLLIGMPIAYLTDNPSTGDVIGLVVITAICLALLAWIVLSLRTTSTFFQSQWTDSSDLPDQLSPRSPFILEIGRP